MSRAQAQYLDRYAEPEASLAGAIRARFAHVLTIPAYAEGGSLFDTLASIPAGSLGDVLTILVINGRVDSPDSIRETNRAVLERLESEFGSGERIANGVHLTEHPRGALLLIDRATPGRELPARHGVGCGWQRRRRMSKFCSGIYSAAGAILRQSSSSGTIGVRSW